MPSVLQNGVIAVFRYFVGAINTVSNSITFSWGEIDALWWIIPGVTRQRFLQWTFIEHVNLQGILGCHSLAGWTRAHTSCGPFIFHQWPFWLSSNTDIPLGLEISNIIFQAWSLSFPALFHRTFSCKVYCFIINKRNISPWDVYQKIDNDPKINKTPQGLYKSTFWTKMIIWTKIKSTKILGKNRNRS